MVHYPTSIVIKNDRSNIAELSFNFCLLFIVPSVCLYFLPYCDVNLPHEKKTFLPSVFFHFIGEDAPRHFYSAYLSPKNATLCVSQSSYAGESCPMCVSPLWQRFVEYPKFTPGDPRPRCFLPPYWMKMLYPGPNNPTDHVVFKVHPQMTKYDVQQYLEKIYDVPVVHVRVKQVFHDLEPNDQSAEKRLQRIVNPLMFPPKPERYEKLAYVRLAPGTTFEFPDLFKIKRPSTALDSLESEPSGTEPEKQEQLTKEVSEDHSAITPDSVEVKARAEPVPAATPEPDAKPSEVRPRARGPPKWFS
ncbi:39S ribosomal protein L23 [Fasciola gigantica]|uniref:Large ribosomal subunit protein uL23m n=1 Tax=Fasciola gigantica TaxID=46835 RepID=A0A504YNV8_FASGI|nr:39S ribosomal protein L23 [Fasciola gigantica]